MQYIVTVQQGLGTDEEHVYFCDEHPVYHSVMDADGSYTGKVDVAFTPKNGRYIGSLMIVPRERLVSITERE